MFEGFGATNPLVDLLFLVHEGGGGFGVGGVDGGEAGVREVRGARRVAGLRGVGRRAPVGL